MYADTAYSPNADPQVAEAKEVTAFAAKYKEAKRCRAYEAYQHLAAAVTFDTHIDMLLSLVRDKLPSATSPTIRSKLEQLLAAAARGVSQNPSVNAKTLAQWLGAQLESGLRVEEAARAKAKAAVGAAVAVGKGITAAAAAGSDGTANVQDSEAAAAAGGDGSAHLYMLNHFCLTVLNGNLKRGVLSGRDPASLALLDPLLPLLVRCLGSRHMGSVQVRDSTAVSCVIQMLVHILSSQCAAARNMSWGEIHGWHLMGCRAS